MGKNHLDAEMAIAAMERGENPLDNYEIIKAALLEDKDNIHFLYELLPKGTLDSLKESKECKKIITDYEKELEAGVKELEKESNWYKFQTYHQYEAWKAKQKKPYSRKARHIICIFEVLFPFLKDAADKIQDDIITKASSSYNVAFVTTDCIADGCPGKASYHNKKFRCDLCGHTFDEKQAGPRNTEMREVVLTDPNLIPNSDVYADAIGKVLEIIVEEHVKKELKAQKKYEEGRNKAK